MDSVACRFDVDAFLCFLLQKHTALGVGVVCVWAVEFSFLSSFPSFLNSKMLICPTSAEGGNDFWAVVHEMFLCLAGSAHESSRICNVSVLRALLVLSGACSSTRRHVMGGEKLQSKRKSDVLMCSQHSPLLTEGVGLQQLLQELNEVELFPWSMLPLSVPHRCLV